MLTLNLGNLDLSAKRCLELMLRPKSMHVIEPWTLRASPGDKKLLLKICRAVHRDYSDLSLPLVKSDTNLNIPANQTNESFDRHQVRRPSTAPFPLGGPADKYPINIVQGYTNRSASDLYHLKFMPIETESFASLLLPSVVRKLQLWQLSVLHADLDRPQVLRVLRSLYDCFRDVQSHTDSRPRTSAASFRLFEDSLGPREIMDATANKIQERILKRPRPESPITRSFLPRRNIARKPFDSHGGPLPSDYAQGNRFVTTYSRDYLERQPESWNMRAKTVA